MDMTTYRVHVVLVLIMASVISVLAASAAVFSTQPHVNSFSKKRNSVPTDLQSREYCYLRTQLPKDT